MSNKISELKHSRDTNKRRGQVTLTLLVVAIFAFMFFLMWQLYVIQHSIEDRNIQSDKEAALSDQKDKQRLEKALAENQKEHKKTQRYLVCIVLLPVAERTEENFAKCGETGVVDPSIDDSSTGTSQTKTQNNNVARGTPVIPRASQTPPTVNTPPTTSEPPEPNKGLVRSTIEFLDQGLNNITQALGGLLR